MSLAKTFAETMVRRILLLALRGAALGVSLATLFPTEDVQGNCTCTTYFSGGYNCSSSGSACTAGHTLCEVDCS